MVVWYSRAKGGDGVNTEERTKLGRDIDAMSIEADRLSRQLATLAGRFGVKPPEPIKNAEPTYEQVTSACLSICHNYGLMSVKAQTEMRLSLIHI